MSYTVYLTPTADEQIFEQFRYIAVEQKSPQNAHEWWDRIEAAVMSLESTPRRCPLAEENDYRAYEVRKRGIDGFNLLFTVFEDKKEVWVIATRAAGMDARADRLPDGASRAVAAVKRARRTDSG